MGAKSDQYELMPLEAQKLKIFGSSYEVGMHQN